MEVHFLSCDAVCKELINIIVGMKTFKNLV